MDGLKSDNWQVAGVPLRCRRLLAVSQGGPFADRGNKEARLGFVVSLLRHE